MVLNLILFPGDTLADFVGLDAQSDHRQIFRMFINTLFWGFVGTLIVVWASL